MARVTSLRAIDLRFPTSQSLDGSDAINPDPDYSAAYVVLGTDSDLHEHFLDPCRIENAAYMPPSLPGFSIEMKPESIAAYTFKSA